MIEIISKALSELIPYEKNPRKISDEAVNAVAESIQEFGFKNPILIDKNNVIIAGHTRRLASLKLGLERVPCVVVDDLTPQQIKALRLADNKTNELAEWDFGELDLELADLLDMDMERFGFDLDLPEEKQPAENPYTMKIDIPVYEPTGEKVAIKELYDNGKAEKLIEEIDNKEIPEDVKKFLRLSAYRHTVFNYKKIAEYYANSPREIQELMEKSALVIIDFDKAIENGFVQLSNKLEAIWEEDSDD